MLRSITPERNDANKPPVELIAEEKHDVGFAPKDTSQVINLTNQRAQLKHAQPDDPVD